MKKRKHTVHGEISNGEVLTYNGPFLKEFLKNHNNKRVTIHYEIGQEFANEKDALIGYYHSTVLPTLVEGFRSIGEILSPTSAHNRGLEMTTVGSNLVYQNGKHKMVPRETGSFDAHDWWLHINDLIIIIETEMHIKVEQPRQYEPV